jgi:hypothetical protein
MAITGAQLVSRHTSLVTLVNRYVFLVDMVQRPPQTETDQMLNVYAPIPRIIPASLFK